MKYRFLLHGHEIDRDNEFDAKIFAASVPVDTAVLIFVNDELIDSGKVTDIWDLPNESYQEKLNNKIHKK